MSLHHAAPAPNLTPEGPAPGRKWWPFVAGAAALLVIALVAAFAVLRDDATAAAEPAIGVPVLADGVTAGGPLTGQARTLAKALGGLECSVRFTGADGGQAGCFTFRTADQILFEVVYQYRMDGTVIGLNVKVEARKGTETGPALRDLVSTVARVVFPADQSELLTALRAWGGARSGSWGDYEFVGRGERGRLSASKSGGSPIKVPVLHLDTPETGLAGGLRADGFACARDNESCHSKGAGKPGQTVQMSGPDTGITYLVASADTQETFVDLQAKVFGHLRGAAVEPFKQWLTGHLDGRSHLAYIAGWRVDLRVFPGATGKLELTVFNEEVWQVPE
jgi:hypothetical protein